MNEEKILKFIKSKLKIRRKDVIVGPGDDTAVLRYDKKYYLLATTDCLVEDVHFRKKEISYYQLGRKAIAVNLSDIAAMGGFPLYALVSAGFPEGKKEMIDGILKGMEELAEEFKFDIVGGNLTKSQFIFIDIFMVGKVEKKYLKLRNGAKPGDLIFVTGKLGASQLKKHLFLRPRINEARRLVKKVKISAMIDISDGLSSDLIRIAKESNVGFEIYSDKIPVSEDAVKISKNREEAILHALSDGEDYELLFTVPEKYSANIPEKISSTPVTFIGRIISEKSYYLIENGKKRKIGSMGFNHFG
ncbi:MAG: thiamine-monophosphate kinase [Candidatus Omnitrophota bacterium]|nr:MAG: thiamine-monophosphate kinase [Candidatus Omnitrophota bacterium]